MKTKVSFSQAIAGYELYFEARHLSPLTYQDYSNTFRKFAAFLDDDPPIDEITADQVRAFLAKQDGLSNKTLLNYHTGLSALWSWAVKDGLTKEHVVQQVARPKPEQREIQPYSEAEIRAMLGALEQSRNYFRPGKKKSAHSLPNAVRNRAILMLLLDTGLRASELCDLRIHQVNLRNKHVIVMGKGSKERILPFCARVSQAIWKYLATREEDTAGDYLFLSQEGTPFNRHSLRKTIGRIGKRAEVRGANPHRFRHTFAISYLRNGGDPFSLQRLLGHSTMEMVKRYLAIAQADLERNHKLASPVDNWRL